MPQTTLQGSNSQTKPRVAVIMYPWKSMATYKFLSNIAIVLDSVCSSVLIITGNTDRIIRPSSRIKVADIGISVHFLREKKPKVYSVLLWIVKSIVVQLKESVELLKARNDVDLVFFYQADPYYLLPLLTAKALRKRTVAYIGNAKPIRLFPKLFKKIQDPLLYELLDGISLESRGLLEVHSLGRHTRKLLPEAARFVDLSHYTLKKQLDERKNIVGFIGRLVEAKGTIDFVRSIPIVARHNTEIAFFIGGDGELLEWVIDECAQIRAQGIDVRVAGWIGEDLPSYLNELKLLVLPTRTDAFPTILVEAIACGTPVLATRVGCIPDVIIDGETGFLLANGQAQCIAETVMKALSLSNEELARIAENAKVIVDTQFSYRATVERFKGILSLTPPHSVETNRV
jgi:glycosyltransferase involved in cell wall biosynthesis